MPEAPESVPINALVPIAGTPLGDMLKDVPSARIDDIEFIRTVAVARIIMPNSVVRLSAGRESMSDSTQALRFMAGANSIFTGDKLLTTTLRNEACPAAHTIEHILCHLRHDLARKADESPVISAAAIVEPAEMT